MPYKRYKKNRRKTRKSRKSRMTLVSLGAPSGMPTMRRGSLRYCENLILTSTLGVLDDKVIRANGMYDPNQTGTGHQPLGFDQWKLLYNHYVVLGSKITLRAVNNQAAAQPGIFGVYLSDGHASPYTTSVEFIEARKGSFKTLAISQEREVRLSQNFSTKKFFNVTDVKDNIKHLGALISADPTEEAYFHLWYQTLNSTTNAIRVNIVIEYIVEFSEPVDLAQS